MRPEEIDYSDTRKHYFDLSNGEVLAGADDRKRYIEAGAQAVRVVELGSLLRSPQSHIDLETADYEMIDTSEWEPERYQSFTRWLSKVVEPPQRPEEKLITKKIFHHARKLGIGPSQHAVKREFGNHSKLYAAAKVAEAHVVKIHDDLSIEEAVAYIQKIGGRRRRPTERDLQKAHQDDPSNPTVILLWSRFRNIGGYNKLVELAGYPVVKLWEREDFLDYGVRFMRANDGQVLTARMANYLSKQQRGPTASTIINHFDYMSSYQMEVIRRFYEYQEAKKAHDREQLAKVDEDLRAELVPLEIFSPFAIQDRADQEQVEDDREKARELFRSKDVAVVARHLGTAETIKRYAKFKILDELTPTMELDKKVAVSRNLTGQSLTAAIQKSFPVTAGEIEYVALTQDFFDYIWPDDNAVKALKLDRGYKVYADKAEAKDRKRRRAAKAMARPKPVLETSQAS